MKIQLKTILKLGAAVLVGAVVFIGSTAVSEKKNVTGANNNQKSQQPGTQEPILYTTHPGSSTIIVGDTRQIGNMSSQASGGLQDVQNVMMKTSQFITTLITVCDAVGKLFSATPMPPRYYYAAGTTIL
jgi:predicted PurR-regulated permease PerM